MSEVLSPPMSEEAEQGVLGSMLMDAPRVVSMAVASFRLTPEMFYVPAHRKLCELVFEMQAKGTPVDLLSVPQVARDRGLLEGIGGSEYLEDLIRKTPSDSHAEFYVDVVRQKYLAREAIDRARLTMDHGWRAERGDVVIQEAVALFSELVEDLTKEKSNADEMADLQAAWQAAHDAREAGTVPDLPGLPLPWEKLNNMTGGFEPGLIILAGRPSQGKTTLEDCVASHWASLGIPVARSTLDMSRRRLLMRATCREAGVSAPKLKFGFAGRSQMAQVAEAIQRIARWPMFITDRLRDVEAICAWARALHIRKKIKALTVDHIGLVTVSKAQKSWNREREVAYVTATLKALALELKIPVVGLCQLSRAMEKDGKKPRPPRLSDLRESGAIEQDANLVFFAYKDLEVLETKERRPVWVDCQKQQDGETGAVEFWMRPHYFRFDPAPEEWKEQVLPPASFKKPAEEPPVYRDEDLL